MERANDLLQLPERNPGRFALLLPLRGSAEATQSADHIAEALAPLAQTQGHRRGVRRLRRLLWAQSLLGTGHLGAAALPWLGYVGLVAYPVCWIIMPVEEVESSVPLSAFSS